MVPVVLAQYALNDRGPLCAVVVTEGGDHRVDVRRGQVFVAAWDG